MRKLMSIRGLKDREKVCREQAEKIGEKLETIYRHYPSEAIRGEVLKMHVLITEADTIKKCLKILEKER